MKETKKDVCKIVKNDTPENRAVFEEKYGSFFLNVVVALPTKAKCNHCGRTEDKVELLRCGFCSNSLCVDHNYYYGYCSIMCAK